MKVLISGGVKTANIVKAVESRLSSDGVDFVIVTYMEDIEDIFNRGEYFDKALIIEQCWNHDFEEKDESIIRERINKFANMSRARYKEGISYTFLAQTEESASMVYEETLNIRNDSVVVVKAPEYSVGFFAGLVISNPSDIPDNIVYRVEDFDSIDIEEGTVKDSSNTTEDVDIQDYELEEIDDISKDLFDLDGTSADGFNSLEEGVEFDRAEIDTDIEEPEETEETEEVFEDNLDEDSYDDEDSLFGDIEEEDIVNDKASGDIPTFEFQEEDIEDESDIDEDIEELDIEELDIEDDIDIEEDMEEELDIEELDIEEDIEEELDTEDELDIEDSFDDSLYESSNTPKVTQFNDSDYASKSDKTPDIKGAVGSLTESQIKATFDAFASRGNSIVVTGCGGCGTSTVAYNLANTVVNLGYTVLLVDMDTEGRAQSYISKDNYNSMDTNGVNLMAALKSTSGINTHVSIVRPGFRLLTMGLGGDITSLESMIQSPKLSRFVNLARSSHNFVIYDMPFKAAVGCAKDVTYTADNIVVVTDSSNWGVTKTMLSVCNIDDDDMQDIVFNRGQLLFNRYKGFNKIMGKKVKSARDITKVMDSSVVELVGADTGFYFQSMSICGVINDNNEFESSWYGDKHYSNTKEGQIQFIELLKGIVLKR